MTERDGSERCLAVSGTLSDVTELRAHRDRVAAANRLASTAILVAGIAHEINNPLASMMANLGSMRELLEALRELSVPPTAEVVQALELMEEMVVGAKRIHDTMRSLRALARPIEVGAPALCDPREEILGAVALVESELARRARMVVDLPVLPHVVSHPGALRRVFVNVLSNAAKAIPEGAVEENEVKVSACAENGHIRIEVRDTGIGMSPQVKAHMFDPFFTTRSMGQGMGLGLSFARAIVDAARRTDRGGERSSVRAPPCASSCLRL